MAFFVLAMMLLVRLGPLCETMAMAAPPAASAMMDCASKSGAPIKKAPASACAIPCVAVAGETVEHIELVPSSRLSPWPALQMSLLGMAYAPATPPPQIV
ncbi:hypothetical protein [Sphingomonas sp. NFX23]|uniref:hypothetical protein n=1 Tax=Sphingomonas sp. NFX23 TaxID=2819532 RepID=UPI003CEC2953